MIKLDSITYINKLLVLISYIRMVNMNLKNMRYTISEDINFIIDAKNCSLDEISSETGISKSTLNSLQKK